MIEAIEGPSPIHNSIPHEVVKRINPWDPQCSWDKDEVSCFLNLGKRTQKEIELAPEQVAFIEKESTCFRKRHVKFPPDRGTRNKDTFYLVELKGVGRVYLHAVLDIYFSYAFGFLYVLKQPEAAAYLLYNQIIPCFNDEGIGLCCPHW